jgi:hypothetical protein
MTQKPSDMKTERPRENCLFLGFMKYGQPRTGVTGPKKKKKKKKHHLVGIERREKPRKTCPDSS